MSNKRYRLKKDISHPMGNCKAGTESIYEGGYYWFPYEGQKKDEKNGWLGAAFGSCDPLVFGSNNLNEWFEEIKEPERIEVSRLFFECHEPNQMCSYCFEMNGTIPIEKHKAVKKAIEDVLNFKDEINYVPLTKVVQDFISKQYTEDDLKDAMAYVGDLAAKHYTNDSWKQNWFNQWKSQRK